MNLDELEEWAKRNPYLGQSESQAFQLLARIARDQKTEIEALHKRVEQLEERPRHYGWAGRPN